MATAPTPTPQPRTPTGDVEAALATILPIHGSHTLAPVPGQLLVLPKDMRAESVKALHDEWRPFPERRKGTANLDQVDSLIEHVNRFKDADSVVFVKQSETDPRFTAVLDYHRKGEPSVEQAARHGQHRSVYAPKVSDTWTAWKEITGKPKTQAGLAAMLEERILDIAPPPSGDADAGTAALIAALGGRYGDQATLLATARRMRIKQNTEVTNAQILDTGEVELVYKTELTDATNQPLRVPNCFSVVAPVFEGDDPYRLWIRLTFRHEDGQVIWTLQRWRPDLIVKAAMEGLIKKVRDETALPVLFGSPES